MKKRIETLMRPVKQTSGTSMHGIWRTPLHQFLWPQRGNWSFPGCSESYYESEANCKAFHWEISFVFVWNKLFHQAWRSKLHLAAQFWTFLFANCLVWPASSDKWKTTLGSKATENSLGTRPYRQEVCSNKHYTTVPLQWSNIEPLPRDTSLYYTLGSVPTVPTLERGNCIWENLISKSAVPELDEEPEAFVPLIFLVGMVFFVDPALDGAAVDS